VNLHFLHPPDSRAGEWLRNSQKSGDVTKNAVSGDNLVGKAFVFSLDILKAK
jgi:hypothetical protein